MLAFFTYGAIILSLFTSVPHFYMRMHYSLVFTYVLRFHTRVEHSIPGVLHVDPKLFYNGVNEFKVIRFRIACTSVFLCFYMLRMHHFY